ncbi:acyl-CoA dehydrogenase family protein [Alcaligenaceae bacterium]|nr:acyl-CoA dehydrogenase family protein [Alcaligenaceae bacterium]
MDFTYDEQQRMLTDSLRRLVKDKFTFEARREQSQQSGLNNASWQSLAEVGVTGLLIPEQYDGFGESTATLVATQLELGRGLVSGPLIPSAVIATAVLLNSGNDTLKADYLPQMAAGSAVLALAYLEGEQQNDIEPSATRASETGDTYTLQGDKKLVWAGGSAHALIVSATLENELALFVVATDAEGLTLHDYPTIDGYRCATLQLNNVQVPKKALLARGEQARQALESGLDYGVTALCAHTAGAMEKLVEITAEYIKTRQQFGKPLAEFQVLQHRLADMMIKQELAASMAYVAATALGEEDIAERRRMLSSAKVLVPEYGRFVGESAVQMHGGIGMTDELEVGDYFKRITFVDYLLGNHDYHLDRLMALFDNA